MAGFLEQRRAMTDAAFVAFGEDATWGAAAIVRVRLRSRDEDALFGQGAIIERVTTLQVRSWDYADPRVGDRVTLAGSAWVLTNDPQLDARGVWSCAVVPSPQPISE